MPVIIRLLLPLACVAALLAGCARSVTVAPSPVALPTATLVPTLPAATAIPVNNPARAPIVGFDPPVGGPGSTVVVFGSGYAPQSPVVVRLGFPDPLGDVLAQATADDEGRWNALVVIPERLPSGEIIARNDMYLVVMDEYNRPLVSAPFGFIRGAEPPAEPPAVWPGPGWTNALESDVNHDGVSDYVYYRAIDIQPQAGFDDRQLANVSVVASDIVVAQPGAEGMWELLRVDRQGARADASLFDFDAANQPSAYVMALDPARGPFMHLMPIGADGRAMGDVRGLDWDADSHTIRIVSTHAQ